MKYLEKGRLPGKYRSTILRALDVAFSAKAHLLALAFNDSLDKAYYIIVFMIDRVYFRDIKQQEICNGT